MDAIQARQHWGRNFVRMKKLKEVAATSKSLANRIAGISIVGFGMSWKAPESERTIVREVITSLEDRRALYTNDEREGAAFVVSSILRIREILTDGLKRIDEGSPAVAPFRMMRVACRSFLESRAGRAKEYFARPEEAAEFYSELGNLRAIFGQQLAVLSVMYKIRIEAQLATILPPDPDADDMSSR